MASGDTSGRRPGRRGGRLLYWLAVTAVSLVLVVALLLLLESWDASTVGATTAARR